MTTTLGVPPGGPGGGTGYGTATSSNDGKPVAEANLALAARYRQSCPQFPVGAPQSSGGGGGGGDDAQTPTAWPNSSGHTKAAAFHKPHRISPGPTSWSQQQQQLQATGRQPTQDSEQSMEPPRPPFATILQQDPFVGGQQLPQRTSPKRATPQTPATGPTPTRSFRGNGSRRSISPPAASPVQALAYADSQDTHAIPGFDPSTLHTLNSSSPINIPPSKAQIADANKGSRQSLDQRARNFGFVGANESRLDTGGTSPGTSPGIASRFREFFAGGKSPRAGDQSDDDDHQVATPYGVSSGAYGRRDGPAARRWSGQHAIDPADKEAEMLRKKSQWEAARLVDEERRKVLETVQNRPLQDAKSTFVPTLPSGIARELTAEGWTSEVLDRMTDDGRMELVRRLSAKSAERQKFGDSPHDSDARAISVQSPVADENIQWAQLTPAQRVIAETRSRHLARDLQVQRQSNRRPQPDRNENEKHNLNIETILHQTTRDFPSKMSATTPGDSVCSEVRRQTPHDSHAQGPNVMRTSLSHRAPTAVAQLAAPFAASARGALKTASARKEGLSPGSGRLPSDFGPGRLMLALQDMMTRFYRFERYAVPLLRSMEARLVDIERDAQVAQADAHNVASEQTGISYREAEMDRWVGQMTDLIKHEIGQLKAGTREIREGRETLGLLASMSAPEVRNTHTASSKITETSASTSQCQLTQLAGAAPALNEDQGKIAHGRHVLTSAELQMSTERGRSASPNGRPKYTSALGRSIVDAWISPTHAGDPPQTPADSGRIASTTSAISSIPSGATIVAEEDDVAQTDEDALEPERSHWSANGDDSRLALSLPTDLATSVNERSYSRARMISPSVSDGAASAVTGMSNASNPRSVNERLRALVKGPDGSTVSRNVSTPSAAGSDQGAHVAQDSNITSIQKCSPADSVVSAECRLVAYSASPEQLGCTSVATYSKDASAKSYASSSSTVKPPKAADHDAAAATQRHLALPKPSSNLSVGSRPTSSPRSPSPTLTTTAYPASGLIGGRTSPSPASFAGLAARASPGASPGSSAHAVSNSLSCQNTGSMPVSPTLPVLGPGEEVAINTKYASEGLRARAKSYLTKVDGGDGSSPAGSTAMRWSPSKKEDGPPASLVRPLEIRKERSFDSRSNLGFIAPTTSSPNRTKGPLVSISRGPASKASGLTLKERVAFFEVASR